MKPKDVKRPDLSIFPPEVAGVIQNIVSQQKKANPKAWTNFSWWDYKAHCTHRVFDIEEQILDGLLHGGRPHQWTNAKIEGGYLSHDHNGFRVTEKLVKILFS